MKKVKPELFGKDKNFTRTGAPTPSPVKSTKSSATTPNQTNKKVGGKNFKIQNTILTLSTSMTADDESPLTLDDGR